MSLASNIICGLKLSGLISGGYIGYRYGDKMKNLLCNNISTIKYYHSYYISSHFKRSQISESTMFNLIGGFSGVLIGYHIFPISIPLFLYICAEDYPEEFKKIKKFIKD
jgi:hypothetical protein